MTDYILPKENIQISFSGGRTSAYMLYKILEANNGLPKTAKVIFTNTGREMEQTLDFVQECSDRWNVNIIWLEYDIVDGKVTYKEVNHETASRNGEPFVKLLKKKKFMPSPMARFCTQELKMLTIKRYITNPLDTAWKKWVQVVGIRADESHRAKKTSKDRWSYYYPLVNNFVTKKIVANFWEKQPFDLMLPNYNGKTPSGNCDFCFLKSEDATAYMIRHHADRLDWWINIEKEMGFPFRLDRDLTKFKKYLDDQQDWVFEEEGYFCQANSGECTE
tara:strand:- start:457 stop:1284 length:828 start_codon:yes stop_codon:yes gene_type:complete